jgi:serine/threonine protein phosphatase PrpC
LFSSPIANGSSSAAAAASAADSGAVLEVGVAEDPNPRFRPTMEDAHVVRLGDSWVDEEAATGRSASASPIKLGGTARKPALDWGTTARKGNGNGPRSPHKSDNVHSGYFAVYDGHGGREAVEFIEKNLHRQLARKLRDGAHPSQALEAAFLDTDSAMVASRRYQDCGSTVASALIRPSTSRAGQRDLFVANVGDARAVVAVKGSGSAPGSSPNARSNLLQAVRLSRDHTPNDPAEAERVRRAGGAVFRGRVDGQLAVSRAMGDHSLRRSGVSAEPHQQHIPLTSDHKFMIVACDGLWDVMSDGEAVNLVAGMTDANKMADKLVKTAMQRGTTDKSVAGHRHASGELQGMTTVIVSAFDIVMTAHSRECFCFSVLLLVQCFGHGDSSAKVSLLK